MNRKELCKWLKQNSSGIYRPAKEAASEIERLENALIYAKVGLDEAYKTIEKEFYDEAMLHCGFHSTRIYKVLNEVNGDNEDDTIRENYLDEF